MLKSSVKKDKMRISINSDDDFSLFVYNTFANLNQFPCKTSVSLQRRH